MDFLDRFIANEEGLRREQIRNRQQTVTKTFAMEGTISTDRHFPPWTIDLDYAPDPYEGETLQLFYAGAALFAGTASVQLLYNETPLTSDWGMSTYPWNAGSYLSQGWGIFRPLEQMLWWEDILRPEVVSASSNAQHLSVTVACLWTPAP